MARRDRDGAESTVGSSAVRRTGTGRLTLGAGSEGRLTAGGLVGDGRGPTSSSSMLVSSRSLSWPNDSFARRAILILVGELGGGFEKVRREVGGQTDVRERGVVVPDQEQRRTQSLVTVDFEFPDLPRVAAYCSAIEVGC